MVQLDHLWAFSKDEPLLTSPKGDEPTREAREPGNALFAVLERGFGLIVRKAWV
jgi:hypothetical protein